MYVLQRKMWPVDTFASAEAFLVSGGEGVNKGCGSDSASIGGLLFFFQLHLILLFYNQSGLLFV